ncbi:hypothetical protein F442_02086 [Phytophthora nicotianae P10297]|uniref:Uncharacterized protein n=1 Tax=Phytophthora nicotianae P10297 TaxID=1317064 RepID=W3A021_PHYNI|nr:hypothetical protein F442_02086 [Phytophthora nicotianae P10297]
MKRRVRVGVCSMVLEARLSRRPLWFQTNSQDL